MVIACTLVFGVVGFILIKGILSIQHDRAEHLKQIAPTTVHLNTSRMRAIYQSEKDTISRYGDGLLRAFLCKKSHKHTDTLWADAYLCSFYRDTTQTHPDTVLVLDTDLQTALPDNLQDWGIMICKAPVFPHCKIVVPKNFKDSLKRYPFRYGRVEFWTD